jgi:hypothetical protein
MTSSNDINRVCRRRPATTVRTALLAMTAVLAGCLTVGCDARGTEVYLNEQLFEPPATSASVSCMMFELNDNGKPGNTGGGSECAPGAPGVCLGVKYGSIGNEVVVDISDGGRPVVQKRYDEAFFRSGRIDEFTVRASSGREQTFRYWGGFDGSGHPICAARAE